MPWYWWPAALAVSGVLALQFGVTADPVPLWLPATVMVPATLLGLWLLGRIPILVTDDQLQVDDARLPLRYVKDAIALDPTGRRELLGPHADPLAFVIQRPWISGAVQVLLDDPDDPTPYWLVSSRDPVGLAAALTRADRRAPAAPPPASPAD